MSESTKDAIHETLNQLHAAQSAHDINAMLNLYAPDGYINAESMRQYFGNLIDQDAFKNREIDWGECQTFIYRDTALVKPVIYRTRQGQRYFSFHLKRDETGWRIIDNNRSQSRHAQQHTPEFMANAGKIVGSRAMMWTRRFDAPVEQVWQVISTKKGLDQWWLTHDIEIDLRPDGKFEHHWLNTIRDFKVNEFIDFVDVPVDGSHANNLMRFEVQPDGDGSLFTFLDGFMMHQFPLSIAWTASGWHGRIDSLETALTGREIKTDFGLGGEHYWQYLCHFHRYADMIAGLKEPDIATLAWRQAYLTANQ